MMTSVEEVASRSPPPLDHHDDDDDEGDETELSPEEIKQCVVDQVANHVEQWIAQLSTAVPPVSAEQQQQLSASSPSPVLLDLSYEAANPEVEIYPVHEWLAAVIEAMKRLKAPIHAPGGCSIDVSGHVFSTEDAITFANKFLAGSLLPLCPANNRPFLDLNLENTRLNPQGFAAIVKALLSSASDHNRNSNHLRSFNVRENPLRCDSMPDVAKLLSSSPHLETLHLGSSFVFPEGVEALCLTQQQINNNNSISTLSFGLRSKTFLQSNSLREFSINYNTIGDKAVSTLCQALAACRSLEIVNLSECSFGDKGARAVVQYLLPPESCAPLVQLDLSCNKIGAAGAAEIAGALTGASFFAASSSQGEAQQQFPVCSLIEFLDVGNNPIGDEGGLALAAAAAVAPRLRVLGLVSCELCERAGELLIAAMEARPASFQEAEVQNNGRLSRETRSKLWKFRTERKELQLPPRPSNRSAAASALSATAAQAASNGSRNNSSSSSNLFLPITIERVVVATALVALGAYLASKLIAKWQKMNAAS